MKEALKYLDSLYSTDFDIFCVDVCIISPSEKSDVTKNEDINDKDLGAIIPINVTGELNILLEDEAYDVQPTSHTKRVSNNFKQMT